MYREYWDNWDNEDLEERRPVKKKRKNLPIVESDKEELQSDNEMDSKEQNSNKKLQKMKNFVLSSMIRICLET